MNKNIDVKFQQRWDFRRREDADSSGDDSKSNSSGGTKNKKHKLVPNLVLPENNEVSDHPPICQQHNEPDNSNDVRFKSPETAKKKIKSIKKKNVAPMKSKRCLIKENKKTKRRVSAQERKMSKDLKIFADSLLQELKVTREKMFVQMQEEMRKLVASGPSFRPTMKDARCSQKNPVQCRNGMESGVKLPNCSSGSVAQNGKSNVDSTTVETGVKFDQGIELTTDELHKGKRPRLSSKSRLSLANDSNQVVSSPYLTLPTIVPKPILQNHRSRVPLDDYTPAGLPKINSGSADMDMVKLMNAKTYYAFPTSQLQKQFGSFPQISSNSAGQNCSQMSGSGVRFPVPVLHQGLDIGSNISTLTDSENSFKDNSRAGLSMNGSTVKFPGRSPALSEHGLPNGISSDMHHRTNGEFLTVKPQDLKDGRFYPV